MAAWNGVRHAGATEPPSLLLLRIMLTRLRLCTLQKIAPDGTPTKSAHPARFSPDDKFSRERITCKKRFGLLPIQKPPPEL